MTNTTHIKEFLKRLDKVVQAHNLGSFEEAYHSYKDNYQTPDHWELDNTGELQTETLHLLNNLKAPITHQKAGNKKDLIYQGTDEQGKPTLIKIEIKELKKGDKVTNVAYYELLPEAEQSNVWQHTATVREQGVSFYSKHLIIRANKQLVKRPKYL